LVLSVKIRSKIEKEGIFLLAKNRIIILSFHKSPYARTGTNWLFPTPTWGQKVLLDFCRHYAHLGKEDLRDFLDLGLCSKRRIWSKNELFDTR
jgi:hypothetical protein